MLRRLTGVYKGKRATSTGDESPMPPRLRGGAMTTSNDMNGLGDKDCTGCQHSQADSMERDVSDSLLSPGWGQSRPRAASANCISTVGTTSPDLYGQRTRSSGSLGSSMLHFGHESSSENDLWDKTLSSDDDTVSDQSSQAMGAILRSKLHALRCNLDELSSFELSCEMAKTAIRETAQDLIQRICDHEKRLVEEVDSRWETEIRKLNISKDQVEDQVSDLDKLYDYVMQVAKAEDEEDNEFVPDEVLTAKAKAETAKCQSRPDDMFKLPDLTFVPIRCNTAFGTINSRNSPLPGRPISRQRATTLAVPSSRQRQRANSAASVIEHSVLGSPKPKVRLRQRAASLSHTLLSKTQAFILDTHNDIKQQWVRQRSMPAGTADGTYRKIEEESSLSSSTSTVSDIRTPVLLWTVNTEGKGMGQINCPRDVAFLSGDQIVVADKDNERLQIFDQDGNFIKVIGQGKVRPRRLAITPEGNMALTDSKEGCIKVYNMEGQAISSWGKKRFRSMFKLPCGIAVNSAGHFIVTDTERRTVSIHHSDGKCIKQLGSNDVTFNNPAYVSVNDRNQIIVSDNWNHCVKVFDSAGNFLFEFEGLGGHDILNYPNGVCANQSNNIIVADWGNHTISMFSPVGQFERHLLTREDGLSHPAGLAVSASGLMVVTEYCDNHSAIKLYQL